MCENAMCNIPECREMCVGWTRDISERFSATSLDMRRTRPILNYIKIKNEEERKATALMEAETRKFAKKMIYK